MNSALKILVVDDSPLVAPRVRSMLDFLEPSAIIGEAVNAEEAMDIMQEVLPDVVTLDLNLPGKNGMELLREIKLKYPSIVVVVFSNHAEDYYRNICKQLGADYFLDKSTEFEMLPDTLREVVDMVDNPVTA